MGATQCKCCAKEGEIDQAAIIQPTPSAYDEEKVAKEAQTPPEKSAEAAPAAAAQPALSPPQPPPAPPAPAPVAEPPKPAPPSPREEPPLPPDVRDRCKRLTFQLEAGRPLDAKFVAVKPSDEPGASIAVVNSIGERSPLATTSSGQPGLKPGDVVLEVNGQRGFNSSVLEAMGTIRRNGGKMDLQVCSRPKHFAVEIKRPPGRQDSSYKMGVVVAVHDDIADRLEVRAVSDEGAVADWNQSQPFRHVCVSDWVTKVEGSGARSSTQAKAMLEDMQTVWKNSSTLTLSVTPGK